MDKAILPEFQSYLVSRSLALEKNVPFYAYWASKFISFSNKHGELPETLRVEGFLSLMKKQNMADWQIRQAEQAVRLYLSYSSGSNTSGADADTTPAARTAWTDIKTVLGKTREAIRIKHYSYSTERTYLDWIRRFYGYVQEIKKKDTCIAMPDSSDVRDYLSHLAIRQRVSSSTQNQAFNALLFLFREVLKVEIGDMSKTVRAKRGPKIPVVLTVEETQGLFKHAEGKDLLIMQLLYGSGLRLMELCRLRVKDIDFDSCLVFVRGGKGDKDRTTMLPACTKEALRVHLDKVKVLHENDLAAGHGEGYLPGALERKYPNAAKEWGWQYVFPSAKLSVDPRSGKIRRHHISEKTVQDAVRATAKKAKIVKHATVHTLRHSFATHLLMNGVNIREVQELLGHKNVETTMVYTHVLRDMSNIPKSPLDYIYANKR